MIDLKKLEELARAATPGPWTHKKHGVIIAGKFHQYTNGSAQSQIASFSVTFHGQSPDEPERQIANSDFAAAANPAAILDLIALVRKQEGELSAAREANDILLEQSNTQISEIERLEARPPGAGQWVACTPSLISAGVDCGKTPRRPGGAHTSHEHWIAHTPASPPAASKEEIGNALMMAAVNCSHAIDDDKVVLRRDADKPGGSLRQLRERLADAMMIAMTERAATTTSLVELRDLMHSAAQAGELIALAPEAAGALVLAMSTGAPSGGEAPAVDLSGLTRYDAGLVDVARGVVGLVPKNVGRAVLLDDVRALLAAAPVAHAVDDDLLAAESKGYASGLRFGLLEGASILREVYINHVFSTGIKGLENRCKEAEQVLLAKADAEIPAQEVPASPLTQAQIDHIGEQWDGCWYDNADIGACLRAELAKIGGVK